MKEKERRVQTMSGMFCHHGLLKQLVAWLKYKGFFSRLFCYIPLFAAVPVPSFGYPVPLLELPSLLPVSPPPVIHNKHTLVSHKKKSVTMSFCQWHTQRGKGLSTHLGNVTNTHRIIHNYIWVFKSFVVSYQTTVIQTKPLRAHWIQWHYTLI